MDQRKEDGIKGRIVALGLLAAFGLAATAQAGSITQIVSFGDSLSDVGNVFVATGGAIPDPSDYSQGRFSSGPVWVEHLAGKLGVASPTPSLLGGTGYAWGGAESGTSGDSWQGTWNLGKQIDAYLATNTTVGAGSLVAVWAGANDFLSGGQLNPGVVVANIAHAIRTLADAGGSEFLVASLPMLGDLPEFKNALEFVRTGLNGLISAFNAQLEVEVATLRQDLGVTIHYMDVGRYFQEMMANPSAFGLNNTTDPMMGTGEASGYLFWDTLHPTTQVHALIADLAFRAVVPEPSSIVMLGIAGAALTAGAGVRRRRAA